MWVGIQDLITYAAFGDDRLIKGFGRGEGRIFRFSIDFRRRPYSTLTLPCEVSDSATPRHVTSPFIHSFIHSFNILG